MFTVIFKIAIFIQHLLNIWKTAIMFR